MSYDLKNKRISKLEVTGKVLMHKGSTLSVINSDGTESAVDLSELGAMDSTPGTATAGKALVVDGSKGIVGITNLESTSIDAGASGAAGSVDIFPATASKGKLAITAADSAGNTTTSIVNASQAGARTYTIPDAGGNTEFVMAAGTQTIAGAKTFSTSPDAPVGGYKADGVTLSQLKWVDVTVTAALLDSAGTVPVIAGVTGDQYKIRNVRLVGGGTNFDAAGDRLISLTDGTTVWTTIANTDIEAAPAATLDWGNAKVPFLTGTSDTASASNAAIRFEYSGGTTDHSATGSIKFSVCLEKVA